MIKKGYSYAGKGTCENCGKVGIKFHTDIGDLCFKCIKEILKEFSQGVKDLIQALKKIKWEKK